MSDWQKIDLHIHSSLSPCAEPEMALENIINMAKLIGLSVISITDHQSAGNVERAMHLAAEQDIVCLPGIEVQTREEVHLLGYFPNLDGLLAFAAKIQAGMPRIRGQASLLVPSTMLTVEQVWSLVEQFAGCCIPAHLDRPTFSLQSQLGFLPPTLPIRTVEYSQSYFLRVQEQSAPRRFLALASSDAHSLGELITLGSSWFSASLDCPGAICQALSSGDRRVVRSYEHNSLT